MNEMYEKEKKYPSFCLNKCGRQHSGEEQNKSKYNKKVTALLKNEKLCEYQLMD